MATSIVNPDGTQVQPDNAFAEEFRKLQTQQAASDARNEEISRTLAELNRRTSVLNPPASAPATPGFDFGAPTESVQQLTDRRIEERVTPALNAALQASWRLDRAEARRNAAADPALADVFTHFGAEIDTEMNGAVAPAGHVDATYWKRIAKQVAFDQRDELLKRKRASRDTFTEDGGRSSRQSAAISEIPDDFKAKMRASGMDPNDPAALEAYKRIKARRGLQVVA